MWFCWLFGFYTSKKDSTACCCSIPPLCICKQTRMSVPREQIKLSIQSICCINSISTVTSQYMQTSIMCCNSCEKTHYKEYNTGADKNTEYNYSDYII